MTAKITDLIGAIQIFLAAEMQILQDFFYHPYRCK